MGPQNRVWTEPVIPFWVHGIFVYTENLNFSLARLKNCQNRTVYVDPRWQDANLLWQGNCMKRQYLRRASAGLIIPWSRWHYWVSIRFLTQTTFLTTYWFCLKAVRMDASVSTDFFFLKSSKLNSLKCIISVNSGLKYIFINGTIILSPKISSVLIGYPDRFHVSQSIEVRAFPFLWPWGSSEWWFCDRTERDLEITVQPLHFTKKQKLGDVNVVHVINKVRTMVISQGFWILTHCSFHHMRNPVGFPRRRFDPDHKSPRSSQSRPTTLTQAVLGTIV